MYRIHRRSRKPLRVGGTGNGQSITDFLEQYGTRLEGIQPKVNGHQKMGLGEGTRGEEDGTTQMTSGRRIVIGTGRFGFLRREGHTHGEMYRMYGMSGGTMTRKMSAGYSWRDWWSDTELGLL